MPDRPSRRELDDRYDDFVMRGFDDTVYDEEDGRFRIRCSQCRAAVIQGLPCHEIGCPNARRARRAEEEEEEAMHQEGPVAEGD